MLLLLLTAQIDPTVLMNLRNQVKCEQGCLVEGYDTGAWHPKRKKCYCQDEYELSDLFLKKFNVRVVPPVDL